MVVIQDHEWHRFHIGNDIILTIRATNYFFGFYELPVIVSIEGHGEMYNDVTDYTCDLYDLNEWVPCDLTWDDFIASTLGFTLVPAVSQDVIAIPSAITTISNNFLNGLHFRGLILSEGLESIGDYAFAGGLGVTSVTERNTSNVIQTLTIPSTVEHIGEGAFTGARLLKKITFLNDEYRIESYSTNIYDLDREIFYVSLGLGDDLDEDGNQYTEVISNRFIKGYDWLNKFHRHIKQGIAGYVNVWSEAKNKKVELPVFYEGAIGLSAHGNDYKNFKLVPVDNAKASPVRVYTSKGIRAVSFE